MALTFDVTLARDETGGYSKGSNEDGLRTNFSIKYFVDVSDPADSNFDPAIIGAFQVLAAPGLPKVNWSVYFRNGKIIPYLVCRRKTARRLPNRIDRWEVDTIWDSGDNNSTTEDSQREQDPPDNLTDIAPKVEIELGEDERVLYDDKSDTPKKILTPTDNYFSQPVVERLATQRLTITQYEPSILFDDMQLRKFSTNENAYRGKPAEFWMIMQVEAIEAEVQLAGGPVQAAQVKYTIELSASPYGWKDDRALIDSHFLDPTDGNKKKPFIDNEFGTYTVGTIEQDGSRRAENLVPDYAVFRNQPTIDFATFLQA